MKKVKHFVYYLVFFVDTDFLNLDSFFFILKIPVRF